MSDEQEKPSAFSNPWLNFLVTMLFSAGLNTVLIYVSPSETMRAFMKTGAVIGSLFGYGVTRATWKGVAKYKRVRIAYFFFVLVVVFFLLIFFVNWILDPTVAQEREWVEALREHLIGPSTWANTIMFLLSLLISFSVAALLVLSPMLDKSKGKGHEE